MPSIPTELEEAVAHLCHARTRLEAARARARRELDGLHEPADRFACHRRMAALGHAEDKLDVALALVTDEVPLELEEDTTELEVTCSCGSAQLEPMRVKLLEGRWHGRTDCQETL